MHLGWTVEYPIVEAGGRPTYVPDMRLRLVSSVYLTSFGMRGTVFEMLHVSSGPINLLSQTLCQIVGCFTLLCYMMKSVMD